jgi:hypothetical protein
VQGIEVVTGSPTSPSPVGEGWIDGISLLLRSTDRMEVLYHEDFQESPELTANPGARVVVGPPSPPLDDPIACAGP